MNSGYDVELLFEQRLRQLGYSGACRPAREDCGVDYVLFTSKGWVGIQVKSAKVNNRYTKKNGLRPTKSLRAKLTGSGRVRGVEHYRENGVSVFALHHQGIFYLIPIEHSADRAVGCTIDSPFREAWTHVLGTPRVATGDARDETAQLETLYEHS